MPTVDEPAHPSSADVSSELLQCVLAVSVLSDVDVLPSDTGVLLPGPVPALVDWPDIHDAIGPHPATGPVARARVETLLRLRRLISDLGPEAYQRFRSTSRVLALP